MEKCPECNNYFKGGECICGWRSKKSKQTRKCKCCDKPVQIAGFCENHYEAMIGIPEHQKKYPGFLKEKDDE